MGLGGGFGDVRLGRILMPLQDFNGDFDPFGTETLGSTHTGGVNATSVRTTTTIYYRSPSMGGLQLHAAIAAAEGQIAGEGAGGPLNVERPIGLGVCTSAGPLSVSAAYDRNSSDRVTKGLYGKYNFGPATALAQWENGDVSATSDVTRWSIGAMVPMGNAMFKAGYTNWKDENTKKIGAWRGLQPVQAHPAVHRTLASSVARRPSSTAKKAMFDVGIFHKF